MTTTKNIRKIAIVGGGLAGLAAAAFLARAGQSVILFEKSRAVGGRALTQIKNGFHFNLGPHALYRAGRGVQVLRELGIKFSGGMAPLSSGYAIRQGMKHALPGGLFSLLTTGLLGLPAKLEAAYFFTSISKINPLSIQSLTLQEWLESQIRHPDVRRLLSAFFRLTTYADDSERQSAGAALAQLQMSLVSSVYYLDSGWQVLVDGLRRAAEESGAQIVTGAPVAAIEHDGAVRGVRLTDGTTYTASAVIVAASPTAACALVEGNAGTVLPEWAKAAVLVRAACLDIALRRLPQPRALFALGIDVPLYLSVHSAVARLSPPGGALVHAAKYLGSSEPADSQFVEQELEELLDLIQPGWRDAVVTRRFMPNMVVSNALVTATLGGTVGRPGPEVPDIHNLYVIGDWVGPDGMLSDASLASARRAAELILNTAPALGQPTFRRRQPALTIASQ